MSLDEHRGSAWAFRQLMEQAKAEIESGKRKGVSVKFKTADWAKTKIGWAKRRMLLGQFRRRG